MSCQLHLLSCVCTCTYNVVTAAGIQTTFSKITTNLFQFNLMILTFFKKQFIKELESSELSKRKILRQSQISQSEPIWFGMIFLALTPRNEMICTILLCDNRDLYPHAPPMANLPSSVLFERYQGRIIMWSSQLRHAFVCE